MPFVSSNSSLPRAVVTGYCAVHQQHHAEGRNWLEHSSLKPLDLRNLPELPPQNENEFEELSRKWWERFFSCGIIDELVSCGLWRENRLTVDPGRVGVCFSSSKGRPADWEASKANFENSVFGDSIFNGTCDWALREVLQLTGAQGKRSCPVAACASGAHAVALAAQWIADGQCDVVICGAIEAELAPLILAGYRSLGALSLKRVMRPFDAARDGFVPATGGACLILESEAHARQRQEKILGSISGWSFLGDSTSLTGLEPSGISISRAIEDALSKARYWSEGNVRIDYVNAHGTATRMNDEIEARAIERALGAQVPVSSTKSLTGHTLGAAGAIEAVFCLLAMQQGYALPNLNLSQQDTACPINILQEGQDMEIKNTLSLSYGFGGHIGALLLTH